MRTTALTLLSGLLLTAGLAAQPQTAAAPSTVRRAPWSERAVIYELNTRQFSPQGTFAAVGPRLAALKDMGVDIVWFMPIHPIGLKNRKGPLGSPYAVKDFRGVNPEFGDLAAFRKLVEAAHTAGLRVIIDLVANHTAWDHPWTKQHPDWYVRNAQGQFVPPVADWSDVIKLDYSKPALREEMIGAMEFWVREVGVDGFRCDVAAQVPTDFWDAARARLDKIRPVFLLAEAEKPELLRAAFDADYGSEYFHAFDKIARRQAGPNAIHQQVAQDRGRYPAGSRRMIFSSNHDQNTWLDSDVSRWGPKASAAFARLTFLLPGVPLIYNGQEVANPKRLEFFKRDPIDWKAGSRQDLYKEWSGLYHEHEALYAGEYEPIDNDKPQAVLSFGRQAGPDRLVVAANLSDTPVTVTLKTTSLREVLGAKAPALNSAMEPVVNLGAWQVGVFTGSR